MKTAPTFDCHGCQLRIGKTRTHWLIGEGVWCGRCIDRNDLYDAVSMHGTRAGIAWKIGIWP